MQNGRSASMAIDPSLTYAQSSISHVLLPGVKTVSQPVGMYGSSKSAGLSSASSAPKSLILTSSTSSTTSANVKKSDSWSRAYTELKKHLEPKAMISYPLRSAEQLIKIVEPFSDVSHPETTVPTSGRLAILNAMLASGSPEYYNALSGMDKARQVLGMWTKDPIENHIKSSEAKGKAKLSEKALIDTLVPILKVSISDNFNTAFAGPLQEHVLSFVCIDGR